MEDYSGSGLLVNGSSSSCADGSEIPVGTKAFAPFILLELLVALASNIILTALIIKARRVWNNTNIYLFSLSIAGLMEGLVLCVLLVIVIVGKWVLGRGLCLINQFLMCILLVLILLTHLAISRDRYKAVRDPINWQPRVKQALITTAAVWGFSLVFALLQLEIGIYILQQPRVQAVESNFVCFGIRAEGCSNENNTVPIMYLVPTLVFTGAVYLTVPIATIVTLTHYILILRELRQVEQLRIQYSMQSESPVLKINGRDEPVQCTAEERAAKSRAIIFLIQFMCSMIAYTYNSVHVIHAIVISGGNVLSFTKSHPAENRFMISLCLLPSCQPYRTYPDQQEVQESCEGIIPVELKPETTESGFSAANRKIIKFKISTLMSRSH